MGSMLAVLAFGTMAAGTIVQGQAAKRDAENQAAIDEYNAQVSDNDAKQAELLTAFKSRRQAEAAERAQSLLLSNISPGVVPTAGTALLLQARQETEFELENLLIGYEGQIEASRHRSRGVLYRLSAEAAKSRGKSAVTASYIQAGGIILGGFAAARGPKPPDPAGAIKSSEQGYPGTLRFGNRNVSARTGLVPQF